jgi:KDO2-lipid IV(A) lauroyltransferase
METNPRRTTSRPTARKSTHKRHPFIRKLKWQIAFCFIILLSVPILLLPLNLALSLGEVTGILLFHLRRREREAAIENIKAALPFLEQQPAWNPACGSPCDIARQTFANFGISLVETLRLYFGCGRKLINSVEVRGLEHYYEAHGRGKGVIFITGHCGNWELMALSFGSRYAPVSVLAQRQKSSYFTTMLERLRKNFGNSVIYVDGAAKKIFYELRANGIVGILVDKVVPPQEGMLVNFLGHPAWATTMPATLAAKTGVPLLPIFIHREGHRRIIDISPAIELSTLPDGRPDHESVTRRQQDCIAHYVTRHPTEWIWMYKRWKNVPTEEKGLLTA